MSQKVRLNSVEQSPLPLLDGLPSDVIACLESLKSLSDERLKSILMEMVPVKTQRHISQLLHKQQADALTEKEQRQLATLQKQADVVMLRKAQAAVLLRFCRGYTVLQ